MTSTFELDEQIIHLNHAAVGPWPKTTRDAVIEFANENATIGSQRYDLWLETEHALKEKLKLLINARSTDEIAILKNTSEGLSLIAQGINFTTTDNIVIPDEEFPSNRIVWLALEQQGVEVRRVSIDTNNAISPEQELINHIDENTKLVSCSSVQYARGLRLDLEIIGSACRNNGTLFCVDAIQSLGAIGFDAQQYHADFVVADGHKWMCAPEGTALFYCRQEVQDQLNLSQYGWHMLNDAFSFNHSTTLDIAPTAQRFECGSPNMMGIAALNASLGVLLETGMKQIESAVLDNTRYLHQALNQFENVRVLSNTNEGCFAGITTFIKDDVPMEDLYHHLQSNNVICALRGGGIRFSPHYYTPRQKIDDALEYMTAYR